MKHNKNKIAKNFKRLQVDVKDNDNEIEKIEDNEISKKTEVDIEKNKKDVETLLSLNYEDGVNFLLAKYGSVKYDYFIGDWVKNSRNSRLNEGLELHHIDEDKAMFLSNKVYAMTFSKKYQNANRLIYANLLEHLVLHLKISELPDWTKRLDRHKVGSINNLKIAELNDYYSGFVTKNENKIECVKVILPLKEQYLKVLNYASTLIWSQSANFFSSFNESCGKWSRSYNEKIFNEMKKQGIKEPKLSFSERLEAILAMLRSQDKFLNRWEIWKVKRMLKKQINIEISIQKTQEAYGKVKEEEQEKEAK